MSETFRTTSEEQWSPGDGYKGSYKENAGAHYDGDKESGEAGKVLLIGVLGGLLSAAGYMVYKRLPDDQKERLQNQAKQVLQQRIKEFRENFNL
jgi:hypothetical protein